MSSMHPDQMDDARQAGPGAGEHTTSSAESTHAAERPHEWYDDDFCTGGGAFVGMGEPKVACPVCGEMMDVDEDGRLFKHRPRIPGN